MRWTTRNYLHLDRTASAWLIKRFVDTDASFSFVDWDTDPGGDASTAFGFPDIGIGTHDENGTCFSKIMLKHVPAPLRALSRIDACVAAGVRSALCRPRVEGDEELFSIGLALDTIGTGWGLIFGDDDASHLAVAEPLYDSLLARFSLPDVQGSGVPAEHPRKVEFLRGLLQGE